MGTIGRPDILDFKYLSGILVGAWLGGPTRILPLLPAVGLELGQTRQLDCLALPLLPLAPAHANECFVGEDAVLRGRAGLLQRADHLNFFPLNLCKLNQRASDDTGIFVSPL